MPSAIRVFRVRRRLSPLVLCLAFAAPASAGFTVERVDGDTYFDPSLAFDALGRPHMAYGGVHLYHAVFDAGSWSTEIVDPAEFVGRGSSIAFDGAGNPAISYVDVDGAKLRFARWTGAAWAIEVVDDVAVGWAVTSLAFEGATPLIVYRDPAVGLKSARWDGSAWVFAVIAGSGSITGRYSRLALDGGGQAVVSFLAGDPGAYHLELARWDGSQWITEVVDATSPATGSFNSLAFDGSDHPGIAYRDDTAKTLRVARWTGSAWILETVDPGGNSGWFTSIAFDSLDRPLVSYARGSFAPTPQLARFDGSVWTTEEIELAGIQDRTSLFLDATDRPRIGYLSWRVSYATWDGSSWTIDQVDQDRYVGNYPSLKLDSSERPLISYMNTGEGTLELARKIGTVWSHEIADLGFDTGWGSALAIDSADNPHITCFDNDLGGITYTAWDGVQWNGEAVDRGFNGSLVDSTSLAIDPTGAPALAVYDADNLVLKYAVRNPTWQIEVVDADGDVGEFPSLAYDSAGNAGISYFDYDLEQLKFARFDGASWLIEVVDTAPGSGDGGTSLVFDASDNPLIAYTDTDQTQLRLARGLAPGWAIEIVDATAECQWPSLRLDPTTGRPCVSYSVLGDGSLRFARFDGTAWIREVVDTADWWPSGSSLAMDTSGLPRIAYLDTDFWVLKYAYRADWSFAMQRGPDPNQLLPLGQQTLPWVDPEPVLGGGYPSLLLYEAQGLETLKLVRSGQSVRLSH